MSRPFQWSEQWAKRVIEIGRESHSVAEIVERMCAETGHPLTRDSLARALSRYGRPNMSSTLVGPRVATAQRGAPEPVRELPPLDYDEDDSDTVVRDAPAADAVEPKPAPPPRSPDELLRHRDERDRATRDRREIDHLVTELRDSRARQSLLDDLSSFRAPPQILPREKASGIRELTAVALASDWHVEETVLPESVAYRNAYNLQIADARIERFFRGVLWFLKHHRASGELVIRDLVLWLGGDLITGYLHEELMESNSLSPTQAVLWLVSRLRNGIATLLAEGDLEHLEIPCSYGNHGRTTPKTRISTGFKNSFEWLMYHDLAAQFADEPRVHFEVTNSPHQYVDVYGQTIHFHHGDDVMYMGGVGGLGIPLLKALPLWERVRPAALHCIGHHHTLLDYGRAIVNGSLIGFGPYSQRIRASYEPPKQAMFFIDRDRGKCMPGEIWVDHPSERAMWPNADV